LLAFFPLASSYLITLPITCFLVGANRTYEVP
jgi:hypothetical protein